jgi:hypothetical protein
MQTLSYLIVIPLFPVLWMAGMSGAVDVFTSTYTPRHAHA